MNFLDRSHTNYKIMRNNERGNTVYNIEDLSTSSCFLARIDNITLVSWKGDHYVGILSLHFWVFFFGTEGWFNPNPLPV